MFQSDSKTVKTFKYIGGPSGPGINNSRSLPAPAAKGKGRIRVQAGAGDQCVPPAKSRPKKRRNLDRLESDSSAISMESVEWSSKEHDVRSTVETLGSRFPILLRVTKGHEHSEETGLELVKGTILQVHSYGEQERIKAKTSYGSLLSIPLLYPARVNIINKPATKEPQSLSESIRSYPLPMRVIIQSVDEAAEIGDVNIYGMELTLLGIYTELFVRGNGIIEGWIDQANVCVVPGSLDVRLSEAIGMHGASREEWEDFSNMFSRSVRHLNFNTIDGIQGVMFLERGAGHTSRPPPVINTPIIEEDQVYENMPASRSPNLRNQRKAIVQPPPPPAVSHNTSYDEDEALYSNASFEPDSPKVPPKRDKLPPRRVFSLNLPKVLPDLSPQQKAAAIRDERASERRTQEQRPVFQREVKQNPAITSVGGSSRIHVYDKGQVNNDRKERVKSIVPPSRPPKSPRSPGLSSGDSADEQDVAEMFDNVIRFAAEQETRASVRNMASRFERPAKTPEAGRWQDKNRQNLTPKAVVQPNIHKTDNSGGPYVSAFHVNMKTAESNNNRKVGAYVRTTQAQKTPSFRHMEQVPKHLDGLNVIDVVQCLRLLKMDDYIRSFESKQIDGKLLLDLNEDMLRKEFGMTEFNASKLVRFVRGWRPKLT